MVSRRRREKEWTRVMVSTYRDHVIIAGLGALGIRVLEQLIAAGVSVVCLEAQRHNRFVSRAQELNVPVVIRDMKEDQALIDCGVEHARCIVIGTRDAIANLEVAMDAKRMNPKIRVVMRAFDEQIATKITEAMDVDVAFSSSTLAAPMVTAMAMQSNGSGGAKVLSSMMIAGVCHVVAEVPASPALLGKRIDDIEQAHAMKVLSRTTAGTNQSPPPGDAVVTAGDALIIHVSANRLADMVKAS
jgi:Trk K+ transport system NAD-binding subunit